MCLHAPGTCDNRGVWCGIYCADLGSRAAAVATEDGEEGWNLHANPFCIIGLENHFSFFGLFWCSPIMHVSFSLSLSLSPLSLSLSLVSSLTSAQPPSPLSLSSLLSLSLSSSSLSLSLSLDIPSAQEMIKSSLPTFSGALNDKTLQLNNVNSISAQFKRIHNASEYETDPNHVTGIISPKLTICQHLTTVEHEYITFFNISLVFLWRKKSWGWVNIDRIMFLGDLSL